MLAHTSHPSCHSSLFARQYRKERQRGHVRACVYVHYGWHSGLGACLAWARAGSPREEGGWVVVLCQWVCVCVCVEGDV